MSRQCYKGLGFSYGHANRSLTVNQTDRSLTVTALSTSLCGVGVRVGGVGPAVARRGACGRGWRRSSAGSAAPAQAPGELCGPELALRGIAEVW